MARLSWGIALSITAVAAGCGEDPIAFTDAAPVVDAAPAIDAATDGAVEARCGDGVRVAGEVCFAAAPQLLVTENPPHDAQLADVDVDGDLDVFYLAGGEMRYHANDGGVFAAAFAAGFASYGSQLEARDLDGDGRVDLLLGNWDEFTVWRSGGVAPSTHQLAGTIATPPNLRDLVFANLDGAGRPEAVALHENHLQVGVIAADLALTAGVGLDLERELSSLAAGRFDADHRDDLLVGGTAGVALVRGSAAAGFEEPVDIGIVEASAGIVAAGDVDGDGHRDAIFTTDTQIGVARGNGDGTFRSASLLDTERVVSLAVGDLDGDANDDVFALDVTGALHVLLGRDDGTLAGGTVGAGGSADGVTVGGDLNGDGAPEVVLHAGEGEIVAVLISDP